MDDKAQTYEVKLTVQVQATGNAEACGILEARLYAGRYHNAQGATGSVATDPQGVMITDINQCKVTR